MSFNARVVFVDPDWKLEGDTGLMPQRNTDRGWLADLAGVQRPPYAFIPVLDPGTDPPPGQAEVPFWKWTTYEPAPLEACTASAVAGAIELAQRRPSNLRFKPSRAFIYYVARYLLMDEKRDAGASIYQALRGGFAFGFCNEEDWDILNNVQADTPPPGGAQRTAEHNAIIEFRHIDRNDYPRAEHFLLVCKEAIREGHAILFGALVDEDFLRGEFDQGLDIRAPTGERLPEHRHCLLAVKYENVGDNGYFWVRDSLGKDRGDEGYLRMPYEYVTRGSVLQGNLLTDDFWIVTNVSTSGRLDPDFERKRERYWADAEALSNKLLGAYERIRHPDEVRRREQTRRFPPTL
jgi:hypothetical protein